MAADGGVHQAGRVGDAVVPAKPCLVPLGPAALSARRAGQQQTGNSLQAQQLAVEHSSNVIIL